MERRNLSDPLIRGLQEAARGGAGRVEVRDQLVPGLILRVVPSGGATWSLLYKAAGTPRRFTVGPYRAAGTKGKGEGGQALTVGEARARARELLAEIRLGKDPAFERRQARTAAASEPAQVDVLTLRALCHDALGALELAPTTREEWERIVRVELVPWRGDDPAASILRREAREFLRGIVERGSPGTARHVHACARRLFGWAVDEELVEGNPWDVPAPAPAGRSERVLSMDEVVAIWRALDVLSAERTVPKGGKRSGTTAPGRPLACDAVRLLFLTMVRREAVLGLHEREVEKLQDPAVARWTVPPERNKGKHGKRRAHVVPLVPAAAGIVRRRLDEGRDGLAFPALGVEGHMGWSSHFVELLRAEAERQLGLQLRGKDAAPEPMATWTVHGIRHTVATRMVEDLGVPREIVSLLLGHVQRGPAATRIYERAVQLKERRAALQSWAEMLALKTIA
jgi:integrase